MSNNPQVTVILILNLITLKIRRVQIINDDYCHKCGIIGKIKFR